MGRRALASGDAARAIPVRKLIICAVQPLHSTRRRCMARPKRSRPMRDISPTHPNAADIGAKMHVAAVPPDRDADPVRTFGTFTGNLQRMADRFESFGVRTVAMESTGVY